MRTLLTILSLFALASCSKNSDSQSGTVDYSGNYKGNISVTMAGAPSSSLTAYTIGVTQIGTIINLSNNVFTGSSGSLSNATVTLNKNNVAISPTTNLVQYGMAVFSGNNMTIDFREDSVRISDNAVLRTKIWSGVLTKQ